MTIEATLAAILAELQAINANTGGGEANLAATAAVATPATAKATAGKGAAKAPPKAEPAAVTYDVVKAAVQAHVAAGRRTQVVAALAALGTKNAQELKPEQYVEALAALAAIK